MARRRGLRAVRHLAGALDRLAELRQEPSALGLQARARAFEVDRLPGHGAIVARRAASAPDARPSAGSIR
jgi:hypothetical protein